MHAENILLFGHRSLKRALRAFPETELESSGLCGFWSAKDVIAHLASYELIIGEFLGSFNNLKSTPTYDRFLAGNFNDAEVEARKSKSYAQVLDEYNSARKIVSLEIKSISHEKRREKDTVKWFRGTLDLEDFIAIVGYGHKREHAAQFNAFKDQLNA